MIDLFCGAGGFAVGCDWTGFTPAPGIDYFKLSIYAWSHNHSNALDYLGGIRKLSPKQIKGAFRKRCRKCLRFTIYS